MFDFFFYIFLKLLTTKKSLSNFLSKDVMRHDDEAKLQQTTAAATFNS